LLSEFRRHHAADELPQMKFNEVKEVAPGVFFPLLAISAAIRTSCSAQQ